MPGDGARQTLFQADHSLDAENALAMGGIGNASSDIFIFATGKGLVGNELELQLSGSVTQPLDGLGQVQDGDLMGAADVKNFAVGLGLDDRRIDPFHGVAHIGKAASLQAIAMDRDFPIIQHGIDKDRLRATPPAQVMPWAVRAEKA